MPADALVGAAGNPERAERIDRADIDIVPGDEGSQVAQHGPIDS